MSTRLLIIALDGADGRLIDQWSSDGTLPNLAALREMGSSTSLSAPAGVTDDGLWASFKYGVGPGEHGRYHYFQRLSSGKMGMAYQDEIGRGSFWETISESGCRVAIIDVPKCGQPEPINGLHLVDWMVHGRYFHEPISHPESLVSDVLETFGPAPHSICDHAHRRLSPEETFEIVNNLRRTVDKKRAAGLHYLAAEEWDLFAIGFKAAHCAGHHFGEPAFAAYSDQRADRDEYETALRTIYQDLDATVGELSRTAGEDAKVIVFSTTEMVPNSSLLHVMPDILDRINRILGESWVSLFFNKVARKLFGTSAVKRVEMLPYNENCTAIRINSRLGVFSLFSSSLDKKSDLTEKVSILLSQLTDGKSGDPVIAGIDRPSTDDPGKRAAQLPDLLVHSIPGVFPSSVESPELGRIEATPPHMRRGNHAAGGLLIQSWRNGEAINCMENIGKMAIQALCPQEAVDQ